MEAKTTINEAHEQERDNILATGYQSAKDQDARFAHTDENRHARRRRAALTKKLLRDVAAGKVPSPFEVP